MKLRPHTTLAVLTGLLLSVVLSTASLHGVSAVPTISRLGGDIDGEAANDRSGTSVAMSSNGTRIAIGAPYNDGITVNSERGHVRVFSLSVTLAITYDSQGGNAVSDGDATTISDGSITALPTDPTRSGYTFNGLYTASSGGTRITTITPHAQTANFTLYAQWTANTLNISYDSQGGNSISDGDASTTTGASITALPANPIRTGYTFNGWYTAASGGTRVTAGTPHGQTSDFTLYAQWSANTAAAPASSDSSTTTTTSPASGNSTTTTTTPQEGTARPTASSIPKKNLPATGAEPDTLITVALFFLALGCLARFRARHLN